MAEIRWLLAERPDIIGLAVAGMSAGLPGMEVAGAAPEPFEVIALINWAKWRFLPVTPSSR